MGGLMKGRRFLCGASLCLAFIGCGDDGALVRVDLGPTVDGGGTDGGPLLDGEALRCMEAADCDDGIECTVDSCEEPNCIHGPVDSLCDDANPCTADVCDRVGGCSNANVADGTDCVDPGGANGACTAGVCSSGCTSDADCDDAFACTTNTCDADTGICDAPARDDAACDDGNPCTVDACAVTGCNNTPAADDAACTTAGGAMGLCASGACVTGCTTDAECDDGVSCTSDSCDVSIGACVNVPEDSACDDGVDCTSDVCSAATGCVATPVNAACDDGIGCTSDTCDASAGCIATPGDLACDDGVTCTVDVCSETSDCSQTPADALCDDGNGCTTNVCASTGGCGTTDVGAGAPCTNAGGSAGLCDGAGACEVGCATDAECDDGNACNGSEVCDGTDGTCTPGTPLSCDDGVACTEDSCSPGTGCVVATDDGNCDDGNPCTSGACAPTGCTQANAPDTTTCMLGGNSGQCQTGSCVIGCAGDGDCDDGVACTADSCDLSTGSCRNVTADAACDDGIGCTTDTCTASGCQNAPAAAACSDGNSCTTNMCTATGCTATNVADGVPCTDGSSDAGLCSSGTCSVECTGAADCADGDACNGMETCSVNGQCRAGVPLVCNDGNACTADSCSTATGCVNAPIGCDDGAACTTDACNPASGCTFTPAPAMCDDGNECTAQVCTTGTGCSNPSVMDGVSCMGGSGTCQSGACTTSNPTTFRLNDLVLVDPHAVIDTTILGFVPVCGDITNDDLSVFGNTIPNLNGAFRDLIGMDGDGDTFADFGYVLHFDDLSRTNGATGAVRAVASDCTLPDPSACSPTAGGQDVSTTYTVRRSPGNCTPAAVANADTMTWPDGENSSVAVNRPAAGMYGCFETGPILFNLEIELQGVPVIIPLRQTVIAAQFADATETALTNGVLVGFLRETDADAIDIAITDPVNLTVNLGQDVLPEAGQCTGHDGVDVSGGQRGWWFLVNLTGRATTTATGY